MRVRLYQDRWKLEQVLREAERTLRQRNLSLPLLQDAATLHSALKQYAYLEQLPLHQSDERQLQQRFLHAYRSCEQLLADGVPRLHHELRYAPPAVQRSIRESHASLQGAAPAPIVSAGTLQQLQRYKDELQYLFSGEHIVSDGSLQRQCLRTMEILIDLKRYAQAGSPAAVLAGDLMTYAKRESAELKVKLAEHLGQALVTYPDKLRRAGKSALETSELLHIYQQDCTTVERLLDTIAQQPDAPARSSPPAYTKQLIIGARSPSACDTLEQQLRGYGTVERFSLIPYLSLLTDDVQAVELLRKPKALFKEETAIYEANPYLVRPSIAKFHSTLWNLDMVQAPQAWEHARGENSVVAVIDTGIDYTHPELEGRFGHVLGVDFVSGGDPYDDNGHGTHVAGTVAGKSTGVAPQATLYAIKVLDAGGSGSEVAVLRGIEWAIEHNVHVINMSLGSSYASAPEAKLVALAAQKGIAVACAAGNDGDSSYNYPASHPGAISVAAVDRYKDRASFSNYNDQVDLCAPGLEVYSAWPGGSYQVLSGTSMATPHVAGACALLAGSGSIEDQLKATAQKLGRADYFGSGLIQLAEALHGAQRK